MRRMNSRASVALRAWMADRSASQEGAARLLSDRLGRPVAQTTVSRALRGSVPRGDVMSALQAIAGIRIEWWSEPASATEAA